MLIGYARVSTHEQNLDLQLDALNKAGCEKIYECTSSDHCELLGLKTKRHISCFQGLADASTEASFA